MAPKGKDKKGKQDAVPAGVNFIRRPLPAAEGCHVKLARRTERRVVSAHLAFEEWDNDTVAGADWGAAGAEPFEDTDGRLFLPAEVLSRVARWVRPKDLIVKEADENGAEGAGQGVQGKGSAADKGKGKAKGKGASLAPAILEDTPFDEGGNPLPRVFVPRSNGPAATLVDGTDLSNSSQDDHLSPKTAATSNSDAIPRGFRQGWSAEQLQQIDFLLKQHQQQPSPQEGTHETAQEPRLEGSAQGGNADAADEIASSLCLLPQGAVVSLGAPGGSDIDPAMTAIFKAVGQLSQTCSGTGCPLLWEAIHPQTADKVPCYNPGGRYLVKLFAAGRWRGVEVDDSIPVDAASSPVVAASEDPVELWPLLLSKALYKLHRLGGYGLAQEAAVVRKSPPTGNDGAAHDGGLEDSTTRAQFVAFALHSLTGWIPSVGAGVPSMKAALTEGTPGLNPEDLQLPTLPPVDEEEEAARERTEERKRRQALFLHKKRKPRNIERKVVSSEERAEVNSARLRKMEAITATLRSGDRREVYVVCMPGEPAYPVLAVCPPTPPTDATAGADNAAGRRRNNQHRQSSPSSIEPQKARPKTPAEAVVVDGNPPIGFLLKWETPKKRALTAPAVNGAEGESLLANPSAADVITTGEESESAQAKEGEQNGRRYYGRRGHYRGGGKESASEAKSPQEFLSTPECLWLTPRQIERAGGVVVKALTRVDKKFYADLPYHWKDATLAKADTSAGSTKGGKDRGKGKGKDKDNGGKTAKGPSKVGDENEASPDGEHASPDFECLPSDDALGIAALPGHSGSLARDPGCPPAVFLRITPSPRLERVQGTEQKKQRGADEALTSTDDNITPESTTVGEAPGEKAGPNAAGEENSEMVAGAVSKEIEGGDIDGGSCTDGETSKEDAEGEEDQAEDAEIIMCLWGDQPGTGANAAAGVQALAVLQEIPPKGQQASNLMKPTPAGKLICRVRHNPAHNGLLLTAVSARIPLVRGGAPRVFRVMLQHGQGCCVGFGCSHEVEIGDAGQIWAEAGFNQVTETGKYDAAGAGEWRILFRRAFRVADHKQSRLDQSGATTYPADESNALGGTKGNISAMVDQLDAQCAISEPAPVTPPTSGATPPQGENGAESTTSPSTTGHQDEMPPPSSTFVKSILHLPNEDARPLVRLVFIDEDNGEEMVQTSLHTNAIPLRCNRNGYTVMAVACGRTRAMAKGAWRLQLLSDRPLLPLNDSSPETTPSDRKDSREGSRKPSKGVADGGVAGDGEGGGVTAVPCQERVGYGGAYTPNKYLLLFRDTMTCASPLPFSVRLRCSLPGVRLRLMFLDAATGEVLHDVRGGHLLQVLSIRPPTAPTDVLDVGLNAPQHESEKKGKDKGARGSLTAQAAAEAPGKITVVASIDRDSMQVPSRLSSELPYYFQPTQEGQTSYSPPPVPEKKASRNSTPSSGRRTTDASNGGPQPEQAGRAGGGGGTVTCENTSTPKMTDIPGGTGGPAATAEPCRERVDHVASVDPEEAEGPLWWWLEIVGAGEVELAHDTAGVDKENREAERWEAAEPGRAARADLLWTQRQASKVANLGDESSMSPHATTNASPEADGYEDWIKARAAAVGVPVALEKKRHAIREKLPISKKGLLSGAPWCGSIPCAAGEAGGLPPSPGVLLGTEELDKRKEAREALRAETMEFEKNWEANRVQGVETGKEEMGMQVNFIRGREETMKAALLPFLREREDIVQGMIAKAEANKELLAAEREASEANTKPKGKHAKGKSGKK